MGNKCHLYYEVGGVSTASVAKGSCNLECFLKCKSAITKRCINICALSVDTGDLLQNALSEVIAILLLELFF